MIKVDLHSHSLYSSCGVHTVLELLRAAKKKGIKALAVTDHGPIMRGPANSVFFERLDPFCVPGIRLLKGMEANPLNDDGKTDVPLSYLPNMDIVLLGLHDNIPQGKNKDYYTGIITSTILKNPYVDIITHPNDPAYPLDFVQVAEAAKREGVAMELNNSKVMLKRTTGQLVRQLIEACKKVECKMAISSDAHVINELGIDKYVLPYLKEANFPSKLLVNDNIKKAYSFIEERRERKACFPT